MKGRILIVEDNIITAKHIASTLKKFGHEVMDLVSSMEGALQSITSNKPDLAVLDINLGKEVDGIQISEMLRNEYAVPSIFLTSYNDEKTINRIIKVQPLGYIVKPFNPVDLNTVVELALLKKSSTPVSNLQQESKAEPVSLQDFLFVKNGKEIERVKIDDILYIQADGRYTYIFTNERKQICNTPLKTLKEKLSDSTFVQIHKSYLVNLTKVETISSEQLFIGKNEIPISKNFKADLFNSLNVV